MYFIHNKSIQVIHWLQEWDKQNSECSMLLSMYPDKTKYFLSSEIEQWSKLHYNLHINHTCILMYNMILNLFLQEKNA